MAGDFSMMVYKYLSRDRIKFFDSPKLRFSQPSALNDPYECAPGFIISDLNKMAQNAASRNIGALIEDPSTGRIRPLTAKDAALGMAEMLKDPETAKSEIVASSHKTLRTQMDKNIGILSLSEDPRVSLMWSHYCGNHTGFVIELDASHGFFARQSSGYPDIGTLEKVHYAENRPQVDICKLKILPSHFLVKDRCWSYEKEWRLIRDVTNATETIPTSGLPVCLFDIPKYAIRSVVFGSLMADADKAEIRRAISNDPSLCHVALKQSRLSPKTFAMDIVDAK